MDIKNPAEINPAGFFINLNGKNLEVEMRKLETFINLITGHFDNKEQFKAMKEAGKPYPFAEHVNTACNDKIKKMCIRDSGRTRKPNHSNRCGHAAR